MLVAKQHQREALSLPSRPFLPSSWTKVKETLATGIYLAVTSIDTKQIFPGNNEQQSTNSLGFQETVANAQADIAPKPTLTREGVFRLYSE